MKNAYIAPAMNFVVLIQKDGVLSATSATNEVGDGEDYIKAEIIWEDEEQRTAYTNYDIWDEEW